MMIYFQSITMSVSVSQFSEHWWTEICKKVKRAVVFLDAAACECLHWHGGLVRLQESGAMAVMELSSFESGAEDQKKAVFLVGGPVAGLAEDRVRSVVQASSFEYCQVSYESRLSQKKKSSN